MEKRLRSLVLEKFPFELRVEIELLSRRRDLINGDKHDELMKLLRKYNMEDVVPLGPGTNRYAFKLDGFVVKVATDNDGKIDNLKEFKMAKRLYPYVTKTYEVTENGTLLVAEYIQPFESYREMCLYSDKIKDILEKLSDVYLIGDVGITSKNYSNWGLRIGTQEPVCLDFAYVYEVKSELFVCRQCKANAILVPTPDFTRLQCSNPACGKYYLFEDIRAKIGNDIHRHEIGDLSEEGYPLTESGVLTELTEERSNYLKRKEVKKEKEPEKKKEEFVPDNFVMEHSPQYYIEHHEEEVSMSIERIKGVAESLNRDNPNNLPVIRGRVISMTKPKEKDNNPPATNQAPVFKAKVIQMNIPSQPPKATEGIGEVVFEGSMVPPKAPNPVAVQVDSGVSGMDIPKQDEEEEQVPPAPPVPVPESVFKRSFINNCGRAISQISNYAQTTFHMREIFDEVRNSVKDKIWPDTFYRNLQNSMYHSLITFCELTSTEVPTDNGGTRKQYIAPQDIENPKYAPTLLFIQRYWMNRQLQDIEDLSEMLAAYKDAYGEPGGIQREWLDVLRERLMKKEKMKIDSFGIDTIINILGEMWCIPEKVEEPDPIPEPAPEPEVAPVEAPEVPTSNPMDELVGEFHMAPPPHPSVVQGPVDEDEDEGEDDEDGDNDTDYITINIIHEGDFDIVKISCDDPYGYTSIPLYCDLSKVDTTAPVSLADSRNGMWDWLIHLSPDFMFTTKDPERWLEAANDGERYEHQVHMCILDEVDGDYLIGVSIVEGIYEYADDPDAEPVLNLSDEMIQKLNNLICNEIGLGKMSHYLRSVSMRDDAHEESYAGTVLQIEELENDQEEGDEPVELSAAEKAALQVMMGTDKPSATPNHDLKEAAAKMVSDIVNGEPSDTTASEVVPEAPVEPGTLVPVEAPVVASVPPAEEPAQQGDAPKPGVFKPIRRT